MTNPNLYSVDEITIAYKPSMSPFERPKVEQSPDAHKILRMGWSEDIALREEFNILLLDNQNHVLGMSNLAKGGITSTHIDIRLAFVTAIKARACSIIMAHNHPSDNLNPSRCDISLTEKFKNAGKLLDIKILDHIIITPSNGYFSFCDEGLLTID